MWAKLRGLLLPTQEQQAEQAFQEFIDWMIVRLADEGYELLHEERRHQC